MGDLQILGEKVLVEMPRGDEMLRVTYTEARTAEGKDVSWHSLRVFWRNDAGEWRPGQKGLTIRSRELGPIANALSKAANAAGPRQQHRETRANGQREIPVAPMPPAGSSDIDDAPF